MDDLTPISITYVSAKCVGKYPCNHFILIKYKSGAERKSLMDSLTIYKLYKSLNQNPIPSHIKRNVHETNLKDCIIL